MDAREHPADIIAQTIRMFARTEGAGRVGEIAISQLEAAGFTILHDSENHGPTRDRAITVARNAYLRMSEEDRAVGDILDDRVMSAIRAMEVKP